MNIMKTVVLSTDHLTKKTKAFLQSEAVDPKTDGLSVCILPDGFLTRFSENMQTPKRGKMFEELAAFAMDVCPSCRSILFSVEEAPLPCLRTYPEPLPKEPGPVSKTLRLVTWDPTADLPACDDFTPYTRIVIAWEGITLRPYLLEKALADITAQNPSAQVALETAPMPEDAGWAAAHFSEIILKSENPSGIEVYLNRLIENIEDNPDACRDVTIVLDEQTLSDMSGEYMQMLKDCRIRLRSLAFRADENAVRRRYVPAF